MTVSPTVATVVIVLLYAMVIVLLIFDLIVIVLLYAILIVLLIVLLSGYAANRGRGLIVCSTYISYMLSMIQL